MPILGSQASRGGGTPTTTVNGSFRGGNGGSGVVIVRYLRSAVGG